jgi:hypothetical protein
MRKFSILIALLCALATASPAAAAQSPVVGDCVAHGQLTQTYSDGQLKTGLSTMSAAVKEYTNCYDVIQRALLGQISGTQPTKSGTGGSGGSFLPTPVIVLLVLLALAAVTFGAIAIRRRTGASETSGGDGDPPDAH